MKWVTDLLKLTDSVNEVKGITEEISSDVKQLRKCHVEYCNEVNEYKEKLRKLEEERVKETRLFLSVIDHIDDMMWAKDMEGRYIMANKSFREKFCYGMKWSELRGKTDQEIAIRFKELVGDSNHTFGEVCANSDEIIHKTEESRQFLEHGLVNGKMLKLVVNKSPVYDFEGVMFATCGTGRDVTEWHDELERAINASNACFGREGKELLLKELNRLKFEEGDHVK